MCMVLFTNNFRQIREQDYWKYERWILYKAINCIYIYIYHGGSDALGGGLGVIAPQTLKLAPAQ